MAAEHCKNRIFQKREEFENALKQGNEGVTNDIFIYVWTNLFK